MKIQACKPIIGKAFGKSMFPLIKPGDILTISPTSIEDIHISDIIVFREKRIFVSHRVIWKAKNSLRTKGDNTIFLDPRIDPRVVLGKLIKVSNSHYQVNLQTPYSRWLANYLFCYSVVTFILPYLLRRLLTLVFLGRQRLITFAQRRNKA